MDVVHYSWTYFEKRGAEEYREQLVRWAQRMERQPLVAHLVAGGKRNTCDGDVRENVGLTRLYAAYGYNAFCIKTGLFSGGYDYDADFDKGWNRFGWQQRGDGYHNTTRYGEELADDDLRKGSLGTLYRNWHPGPLGFQIASDAFAYVYVSGLLKALDIIEEDMNANINVLDRWFDTKRKLYSMEEQYKGKTRTSLSEPSVHHQLRSMALPSLGDMPKPLFCDPLYCSTPQPPSCLSYEKPTYGIPGIAVQSQGRWQVVQESHHWFDNIGKVDHAIVQAQHDPAWRQKCAHVDACGGMRAPAATGGTLTFALPSSSMTAGLVFVCGTPNGVKRVVLHAFLENPHVIFKLNGRILDKSQMDPYPNPKKCLRVLKHFGEAGYQKEDTMLLTLEVGDGSDSTVEVSQVVVL